MTAKRFKYYEEPNGEFPFPYIKNTDGKSIISLYECCDLLNSLNEENGGLKSALKELKEIGDYQADRIKELNEENQQIENSIQEAYNNERTALGRSVLKQLLNKME